MRLGTILIGAMAVLVASVPECPAQRFAREMAGGGGSNLPQTVGDSKGNQWQIYQGGWLRQQTTLPNGGGYQFFNQGATLLINNNQVGQNNNQCQTDPKTGEIIIGGIQAANGLQVTRRIFVNRDDGYVRYIDVIRNPGAQEQAVTVGFTSSFNYGFATSSMIEDPRKKGQTIAVAAPLPDHIGVPMCIMEMYAGKGAKVAPTITAQPNNSQIAANLRANIPAGKEIAVMHLHGLAGSQDAVVQFVKGLKEVKLLANLPPSIRRIIVNWAAGTAFVGDVEVLRGDVFDVVEMRGGDTLKGTLQEKAYKLETFYGPVDLPLDRVVGIVNVGTFRPRQLLITSDGEIFGGNLQATMIKLQLSSGQVTSIPLGQIARLGYRKRAGEPEEWVLDKPMVLMRSGDRMNVQVPNKPIAVSTRYGTMQLDPKCLAAIAFQSEEHGVHDIYLTDGSKFAGLVTAPAFEMTLAGSDQPVKFPTPSMARLQVAGKAPEIDDTAPAMQLANNDVLVGAIQGQLKVVTAFDTLTLNAGEVRTLRPVAGAANDVQVTMWDETTVSGQLDATDLDVLTNSGVALKVPVALVEEYNQPQPRPSAAVADKIKALVTDLAAEDWKVRDQAEANLIQMGTVVIGQIKALKASQPPEAQQRIDAVLKQLEKAPGK